MKNLYQALSKYIKNAELAHESGDEEALAGSPYNLNCICSNLKKEIDQTTTAPTKLVLITYESTKEEAIPYSIEALEFIAAHGDWIDNIRIVELRNL